MVWFNIQIHFFWILNPIQLIGYLLGFLNPIQFLGQWWLGFFGQLRYELFFCRSRLDLFWTMWIDDVFKSSSVETIFWLTLIKVFSANIGRNYFLANVIQIFSGQHQSRLFYGRCQLGFVCDVCRDYFLVGIR